VGINRGPKMGAVRPAPWDERVADPKTRPSPCVKECRVEPQKLGSAGGLPVEMGIVTDTLKTCHPHIPNLVVVEP